MHFNGVTVIPEERASFVSWLYMLVGITLGTAAAVSAIQIAADIAIKPSFIGPLETYRGAVHPEAVWLLTQVHQLFPSWTPPAYETDIYILSFAGAFLGFGLLREFPRVKGVATFVASLLVTLAVGATFLGLIPWGTAFIYEEVPLENWRERLRSVVLLSPFMFAGAFFAANAFM